MKISSQESGQLQIKVPSELHQYLTKQDFQVYLGQKQYSAKLLQDDATPVDAAIISTSVFKYNKESVRRKRTAFLPLNYRLLPGPVLKLGPVVGVLQGRKSNNEYSLPSGREGKIYAEMNMAATKRNIFMYFFYADEVDWKRKTINGHRYDEGLSSWVRAEFPLPDIIYNRINYRSRERMKYVQTFMEKVAEEDIYLFNTRFLDKWEVHNCLSSHPQTRYLLPDTYAFSKDNLAYCIDNYEEIFLKPAGSSVGKGIIKLQVRSPQMIQYFRVGSKAGWQQSGSLAELYKQLGLPEGEKYILQKGIDLASISGQVFDVRAQVQKNGRGDWQLTGKAIRIAAPGKFVTHVPNGGTKAEYDRTIQEVFTDPEIKKSLKYQLDRITRTVPRVLEENLGLKLAILSIDIGIDKEGKMWIIEVNSKPASFDEDEIRARHLSLLNHYLLYKTEF